MGAALDTIRTALFGNPPSPTYKPSREGVLSAFMQTQNSLETLVAGYIANQIAVYYAARSSLFGNLTPGDRALGIVYNDGSNNGVYIKSGASGSGSWSPTGLLGVGPAGPQGKSFYQLALDTGYIPAGTTEGQFITGIVGVITAAATAARDKAQDWAEGTGAPGGGSTRSSKAWASTAATSAALALQYRDTTASTAATAQAAFLTLGQLYQTVSSGLAATAPNGYFAVAGTGEVFATVYQKVNGSAVLVNILASQAALDRVGRFMPNIANVDNAAAVNAALMQASVSGVFLPGGDIRVDHALYIPSGKFVKGAGMGFTRLIRTDNIAASDYIDRAGIVTRANCVGATVSDLTFVSPKVANKVQGVWFTERSKFNLCERVEAINCGYSFWAQEFASFCTFRDIRSINGNVHFETTRATDILFDGMYADDGDADNPLVVEAVWHCLFGSKRITFRNGRHHGRGHPFLIVADSGTGDEGHIDEIRFENCSSTQTDGKIGFFASAFSGTIGRVDVVDCNINGNGVGGIPMQVQLGDFHFKGGEWSTTSQEFLMVLNDAKVVWENPSFYMDSSPEAYGYFLSGNTEIRNGGRLETTSPVINITQGSAVKIHGDLQFIAPAPRGKLFTPALGMKSGFVFAADRQYTFTESFGQMVSDGKLQLGLDDGATYRILFTGRMKKSTNGARRVGVYIDGLGGTLISGSFTADVAPVPAERKTFTINPGGKIVDYSADMDSASFELSMIVKGNGAGAMTLSAPDGDIILMGGSEFSIERIG